jgi:hypothetical protein
MNAGSKPNVVFTVGDNVGWGALDQSADRYSHIKPGQGVHRLHVKRGPACWLLSLLGAIARVIATASLAFIRTRAPDRSIEATMSEGPRAVKARCSG